MRLASIVEGHGEMSAVPILFRRLAIVLSPNGNVEVLNPIRIPRSRLIRPGELEKAIEFAGRRTNADDGIVVLIDADEECPAILGPELLSRAQKARPDRRISVVLAKCEFEAWFIAAATSIAGKRGLLPDLQPAPYPEQIRDAKSWLRAKSVAGNNYRETVDQAALTSLFDLSQARAADSFDKLYRDLQTLLQPTGA